VAGQQLAPGTRIEGQQSGMTYTVEQLLGAGGQGEVYRVSDSEQTWALKWYFPLWIDRSQYSALDRLVRSGAPNSRYLWPMELARSTATSGLGYIMPLRDPKFSSLADLISFRVQSSFKTLATTGFQLADSFLQLHSRGFCYRDISFGNVFFDPVGGGVLICDNDNVGVDGDSEARIKGTPKFMAPEVVRDDAAPSSQTDLYSLSVLLFYMFMRSHPLEGALEQDVQFCDDDAESKLLSLYGVNPVFIFDPENESNRPVPGWHKNALALWPLYPRFFRDLFIRAFTAGLRDPWARVRESEWRAGMVRLRDLLAYCTNCGADNFYDPDAALGADENAGAICWRCSTALAPPPRLHLNGGAAAKTVVLNQDTRLYPYHMGEFGNYDFSRSLAAVVAHPKRPGVYGLRNLSDNTWNVVVPTGDTAEVPRGSTLSLHAGTRINFGQVQGEIRV
jgi:DNA-binding helix-hairpin-helix protein with protein kinase domain